MNIADMLRDQGIQPSLQRIKIYQYLASTQDHPSADTLHARLLPEIPTLSRTTVYSTLDLFVRSGLALRLTVSETESRYDATMSDHAHCRCRECGTIIDLSECAPIQAPPLPPGWKSGPLHLYIEGLCPECSACG